MERLKLKGCASGHHRLLRALTKYQLFDIREDHLSVHEKVQLAGELEAIPRLMEDKVSSKDMEYLQWEQVYGLRRCFGTCCITPARKAIMDSMLDATNSQALTAHAASHLLNQDGDVLVDPANFRAALTSFLIGARRQILVKTATHLGRCLIPPAADESEAAVQERLSYLLFLLWIIVAVRRKASADAEQIQAHDLVRIRQSTRMKHKGEMAIVLSAGTSKSAKIRIKLPQGSNEMEVGSEELVPLFSIHGLASVMTDFEDSMGRAAQCLYRVDRPEAMLEPLPVVWSRPHDRKSVLREVSERSWQTFKKSLPRTTSKNFSKILETLSLMGLTKDEDRMLQKLQDAEQGLESKRFSQLLRSRRLEFEEASYSKMLYLQASLRAEDPPVDSVRLITLALTTSLIDLCRLNARTHAEVVKLQSSASAVLLPDFIVRDLCERQGAQGGRGFAGSTMTLILALENLLTLVSFHRGDLPARASALLFQTVSSIAINFITSHSRDYPTQPSSWTEKRWARISEDDWKKINRLTDEVLVALDYQAKGKILRLELAVPRCGSEKLVSLDPKSFYDLQQDVSPLVLLTAPCQGNWHYTAITQSSLVVGWFESGLQVLKSETIASSASLQAAAAGVDEQIGSETLETDSKQDDISQEQIALDDEQMALETVVAFLKRAVCRRRREQVAAETIAAFFKRAFRRRQEERPHDVDMFQRMMRYKLCSEMTGADGKRTLFNGNDMMAQERGCGDARYDRIKAR